MDVKESLRTEMDNGEDAVRTAFVIGRGSAESLRVSVDGRSHPTAEDYWDGNWVNATVQVLVGGFRGRFGAYLRTTEFEAFRDGLARLYDSLEGEARFESMEQQLEVVVTGKGRGQFQASCTAMDEAGIGSRLQFELGFDQTEIPEIIGGLERIISAYPTRGAADV